jgi:hypothetical protein
MLSANTSRVNPDAAFCQVERERLDVAGRAIPTRNPHDDGPDLIFGRTPRPIHDSAAVRGTPRRRSLLAHCRAQPGSNGQLTRCARRKSRADRKSESPCGKAAHQIAAASRRPALDRIQENGVHRELGHSSPEPQFVNGTDGGNSMNEGRAFSCTVGRLRSWHRENSGLDYLKKRDFLNLKARSGVFNSRKRLICSQKQEQQDEDIIH